MTASTDSNVPGNPGSDHAARAAAAAAADPQPHPQAGLPHPRSAGPRPPRRLGFLHLAPFERDDPARGLREAVELFRYAESLGLDSGWLRTRHLQYGVSSPAVLFGAIAQATSRIQLGNAVIPLEFENPFRLAEDLATVDLISGGRLSPGLSVHPPRYDETVNDLVFDEGWRAEGYDYRRIERLRSLLRGDRVREPGAYAGFGGDFDSERVEPHSPGLADRLWYGGGSLRSARWAGEAGLHWLVSNISSAEDGVTDFSQAQRNQIDAFRAAAAAVDADADADVRADADARAHSTARTDPAGTAVSSRPWSAASAASGPAASANAAASISVASGTAVSGTAVSGAAVSRTVASHAAASGASSAGAPAAGASAAGTLPSGVPEAGNLASGVPSAAASAAGVTSAVAPAAADSRASATPSAGISSASASAAAASAAGASPAGTPASGTLASAASRQRRPARVTVARVIVPTDGTTPEQERRYRDYVAARTPRTRGVVGTNTIIAPDVLGSLDEITGFIRNDPAFQAADDYVFELPFEFGLDDWKHILHQLATRIGPALGWQPRA